MLWNIGCPMAFLIGDQDPVLPADRLAASAARFEQWGVDAKVTLYPGAGHAFNAHGSSLYHEAADEQSWQDAVDSSPGSWAPEPERAGRGRGCVKSSCTFLDPGRSCRRRRLRARGGLARRRQGHLDRLREGPGRRPADLARRRRAPRAHSKLPGSTRGVPRTRQRGREPEAERKLGPRYVATYGWLVAQDRTKPVRQELYPFA